MSTTDHPTEHAEPASSTRKSPRGGRTGIIELDALKRRKRLDHLEATRSHLATMACQQRSHGLQDAQESFTLQLAVEATIREEFPEEYEEQFPNWLERDIASEHPNGVLTADCGICRSIATARGINLEPPEAA